MDALGSWTETRAAAIHEAAHAIAAYLYGVDAVSTHLGFGGAGYTVLPPIADGKIDIAIALTGGFAERVWADQTGDTTGIARAVAGNGMSRDDQRAGERAMKDCGQDKAAALAQVQECSAVTRELLDQPSFWPLVEGLAGALEATRDLENGQIQSTIAAIESRLKLDELPGP